MVVRLPAYRHVAAAALLAVSSLVPNQDLRAVGVVESAPAADATSCAVTVGTATTDPTLASAAASALAAGYALTDCWPDAATSDGTDGSATSPSTESTTDPAASGIVTTTESSVPVATGTSSGTTASSSAPTSSDTTSTESTSSSDDSSDDGSPGSDSSDDSGDSSDDSDDNDDSTDDVDDSCVPSDGTSHGDDDPFVADGITTAAGTVGWGDPGKLEDFDTDLSAWSVYDGPGHDDNGVRSPSAVQVSDGVLTITGDESGTTGGMSWGEGSQYGRWEARLRLPVSDPTYHAVMLLWPDAENRPTGGEIDFVENSDATRQTTDFFLHYGADNCQVSGQVELDATQWHNWAVEWSDKKITAYVDGKEWYSTTDVSTFPPGPMHLTLQLDWFPGDGSETVTPSTMEADWVRFYPIDGTGPSPEPTNSATSDETDAATRVAPTGTETGTGATGTETGTAPTDAQG
jgi:hypothetical protein